MVHETFKVLEKNGENEAIVTHGSNTRIIVDVPSDVVVGNTISTSDLLSVCEECGQRKFLDERNDEYYCPVHH